MTGSAIRNRHDSDYQDVVETFRELAGLDEFSAEYRACRAAIVERCLPLAENIARRYAGRGQPHDDLVQVARLGLINAVNRYDVESGYDFLAFAVPTMMGEVRRYFRDKGWAVAVPRRLKELHQRINTATAELAQQTGHAPTASDLAAHLDIDREEVVEALIAGEHYRTTSIDWSHDGDEDMPSPAGRIGGPDPGFESVEHREALRPLLAALPDRERAIIAMRFYESLTQTQIAERLGISQMHVSRLLARALSRLRNGLDS